MHKLKFTCLFTWLSIILLAQPQRCTDPPVMLNLTANFINPSCEGLTTGKVIAKNLTGSVAPYFYTLNEAGFSSNPEFDNLSAGDYTIIAEDANGCEIEQIGNLTTPVIPTINLGPDLTIELADEIMLNPKASESVETVLWRADTGLSCYNCITPIAAPTNPTIYSVTVSSIDNCTATDSVLIRILKVRDVYVPNAFSPNQDGLNDILFINAGPEVNNIERTPKSRIFKSYTEFCLVTKIISPFGGGQGEEI